MAMACSRLVTRPPLPPFPERNVPRFLRRIALATRLLAALPYLGIALPFVGSEGIIAIVGRVRELSWVLDVVTVRIAKVSDVARILDSRRADVTAALLVRLAEFLFGLQPVGDRIACAIFASLQEEFVSALADGVFARVGHDRSLTNGSADGNTANPSEPRV